MLHPPHPIQHRPSPPTEEDVEEIHHHPHTVSSTLPEQYHQHQLLSSLQQLASQIIETLSRPSTPSPQHLPVPVTQSSTLVNNVPPPIPRSQIIETLSRPSSPSPQHLPVPVTPSSTLVNVVRPIVHSMLPWPPQLGPILRKCYQELDISKQPKYQDYATNPAICQALWQKCVSTPHCRAWVASQQKRDPSTRAVHPTWQTIYSRFRATTQGLQWYTQVEDLWKQRLKGRRSKHFRTNDTAHGRSVFRDAQFRLTPEYQHWWNHTRAVTTFAHNAPSVIPALPQPPVSSAASAIATVSTPVVSPSSTTYD